MAKGRSKDNRHHVVFSHELRRCRPPFTMSDVYFRFSKLCQACSKFVVKESHSRPCFASFQFRNPSITEKACEGYFPISTSSNKRSFPLRCIVVIFFCEIGIGFFPTFITAPSHDFLPVSSSFCIIWTSSHMPNCNLHSFHCQTLCSYLIVLLQLFCNNLMWSCSKTENTS